MFVVVFVFVVVVAAQAAGVVGAVPWKSEEVGDGGEEEFGECGDDERVDAIERVDASESDASFDTRLCPFGAWRRCAICLLHAGPSSLTS